MKSFTLKLERIREFEFNPYRRHIGIISIALLALAILAFASAISLYSMPVWNALPPVLLLLVSLPENYKMVKNDYKNEVSSAGECLLEFREDRLFCKYNNKIMWSIPFNNADSNPKCITEILKPPFPASAGLAS